jgi:hypothetical protein
LRASIAIDELVREILPDGSSGDRFKAALMPERE